MLLRNKDKSPKHLDLLSLSLYEQQEERDEVLESVCVFVCMCVCLLSSSDVHTHTLSYSPSPSSSCCTAEEPHKHTHTYTHAYLCWTDELEYNQASASAKIAIFAGS